MPVVIVEDSEGLARSLGQGLTEEGFSVEWIASGELAAQRLRRRDVDGVILDLGLPDLDGIEVLRRIRREGHAAPVLVLTARDDVDSRVAALDAGADDYLIKPFAFAELLARLRALQRRAAAPRWAPLYCGDIALDPGEPGVRIGRRSVELSPCQRALLELFLRRRGQVLGRPEILREVFGYEFDPGTNVVDVHVSHLRRKLRGGTVHIETVRGHGYRLCESLDIVE